MSLSPKKAIKKTVKKTADSSAWQHPKVGTELGLSAGNWLSALDAMDNDALDELPYGVIAFNEHFLVQHYNRSEAVSTGLSADKVMGLHVFTQLAQCMNNFMVAQRFEDAFQSNTWLDISLDYLLTWRMRPTPVVLRLLWSPNGKRMAYLVLHRLN